MASSAWARLLSCELRRFERLESLHRLLLRATIASIPAIVQERGWLRQAVLSASVKVVNRARRGHAAPDLLNFIWLHFDPGIGFFVLFRVYDCLTFRELAHDELPDSFSSCNISVVFLLQLFKVVLGFRALVKHLEEQLLAFGFEDEEFRFNLLLLFG